MMSMNEELSGENRVLKRQVEDLTAACTEKDHRVLQCRLEDAGVEPSPAGTATPEPATRPSPSPTNDFMGGADATAEP